MTTREQFNTDLVQQIRIAASDEAHPLSLPESFTEMVLELLTEAGSFSNPRSASYSVSKMAVSAIDWDEERKQLSVIVSDFSALPTFESLTKAVLSPLLKKLTEFTKRASADLHLSVDPSLEVHDLVTEIRSVWNDVSRIRYVVISNKMLKTTIPMVEDTLGIPSDLEIWDIDRLHKLASSGHIHEAIDLKLSDFNSKGLEFLGPHGPGDEYQSYLTIFPGRLLAHIYELYGPRLLELNVRSFLQTRGKVNAGIQTTLRDEPNRFFAFNNGISLTAGSVEISENRIMAISDVQIVNGGQTTASLYHAISRTDTELSGVEVQAKLTVVNQKVRTELAPKISMYSNSQNPVRMADFSANDEFHVELEKISRVLWAPSTDGSGAMSRWFFERARGQYTDAIARERTSAAQRKFRLEHPPSQKILKTDIAKYEHAWSQLPHLVSLGAEKNFREFLQLRKEKGSTLKPDQTSFKHIVSKAILWRRTESLVTKLKLGGYRAPTVAYTIALISFKTAQRIGLERLWEDQDLYPELEDAVLQTAPLVFEKLVASAGSANVTEWAKKKDCWTKIQSIDWIPDEKLMISSRKHIPTKQGESAPESVAPKNDQEILALASVNALDGDTWFEIATWAKETANLQPWQRSLAASIGKRRSKNQEATVKQAVQGQKILEEARRLGFDLDQK